MFIVSFILFLPIFIIIILMCYIGLKCMYTMIKTVEGSIEEIVTYNNEMNENLEDNNKWS